MISFFLPMFLFILPLFLGLILICGLLIHDIAYRREELEAGKRGQPLP